MGYTRGTQDHVGCTERMFSKMVDGENASSAARASRPYIPPQQPIIVQRQGPYTVNPAR